MYKKLPAEYLATIMHNRRSTLPSMIYLLSKRSSSAFVVHNRNFKISRISYTFQFDRIKVIRRLVAAYFQEN